MTMLFSPILRSFTLCSCSALVLATACSSSDPEATPARAVPTFGNDPAATTQTDSLAENSAETESNQEPGAGNSEAGGSPASTNEGQQELELDGNQATETDGAGTMTPAAEEGSEATETDTPVVVDPGRLLQPPTEGTTNLFTDLLGKTPQEVDDKLILAVNRIFGVGTNESATPVVNDGFRLYYELPQDPSMAFIWAPDSADIRSEGMSYGMMIALQMDMQTEFDKLWKFAQTFMQFPANGNNAEWRYYLRWEGDVNTGNPNNWHVNYQQGTGPAPDGEEYFAAALYLANRRWGSAGGVNYLQDANDLSAAMLNNPTGNGRTPVIDRNSNMVVFYPSGTSAQISDPSYHLPAFYEIFAQDGPAGDSNRWLQMAETSRQYFVDSADDNTGLHPDYATFNGTPDGGNQNAGHETFRYDAWRVVMNMAVDVAWSGVDNRLVEQVEKYHTFFGSRLDGSNVSNALFNLDGSNPDGGGSTALTATLASGSLAANGPNRERFVQNLWDVGQQSGQYRYYQETVYALGLLATAGMYGYQWE